MLRRLIQSGSSMQCLPSSRALGSGFGELKTNELGAALALNGRQIPLVWVPINAVLQSIYDPMS